MNALTQPRRLPAAERRLHAVAAVLELAAHMNPAEITTATIAAHMGLTQGALFRHFPDKEAVWTAVMDWVAGELPACTEAAARKARGTLPRLEAWFMAHVRFATQYPGVPRIIFGELQRHGPSPAKARLETMLAEYAVRLRSTLQQGVDEGRLRADLDVQGAATLFLGMVQGSVMQALIAGDPAATPAHASAMFKLYRRALEERP